VVTVPNDNDAMVVMITIPAVMIAMESAVMIAVAMNHNFFGTRERGHRQHHGDSAERCEGDDEFAHYCSPWVSSFLAGP
jgi:hypothetical protein